MGIGRTYVHCFAEKGSFPKLGHGRPASLFCEAGLNILRGRPEAQKPASVNKGAPGGELQQGSGAVAGFGSPIKPSHQIFFHLNYYISDDTSFRRLVCVEESANHGRSVVTPDALERKNRFRNRCRTSLLSERMLRERSGSNWKHQRSCSGC